MEAVSGNSAETHAAPAPRKPRPVSPRSGAPLPEPKGRVLGSKNKITNIRDAVVEAFQAVGGAQYLIRLANGTQSDRTAFVGLMAKVLPSHIQAEMNGTIQVQLGWIGGRTIGMNPAQFPAGHSQTIELERDSGGRLRIANPVPGEIADAVPVQAPDPAPVEPPAPRE